MKYKILPVAKEADIPAAIKNSPVGSLLRYHNLGRPFDLYDRAQILIGMCMDNRKHLRIPDNFAYIIRSGGGNLRFSEFKVSYAIAVGGVRHIALLAHNHCGMVSLINRKKMFIDGLVRGAGWTKQAAEDQFMNLALMHEIGDEIAFVASEAERLDAKYPKIKVIPFFYKMEDNRLYRVVKV